MRKMLVMTGLVAAVSWGAVTAWAGPRTARRTVVPSVSRTVVTGLADAVRSVPTRLGRERVPAAQPIDVAAVTVTDLSLTADEAIDTAVVAAVPVVVSEAVRADVVAPVTGMVPVALVASSAQAAPVAPVAAEPIVESVPLIAVYTPPVAVETAPVGMAASATPAAQVAAPVEPAAPAATVEVVQCGGPDGWETVPDAAACPGDRALRIERVPVDA